MTGSLGLVLLGLIALVALAILAARSKPRPACRVCFGALVHGPICSACGHDSRITLSHAEFIKANNDYAERVTRDRGLEDRD